MFPLHLESCSFGIANWDENRIFLLQNFSNISPQRKLVILQCLKANFSQHPSSEEMASEWSVPWSHPYALHSHGPHKAPHVTEEDWRAARGEVIALVLKLENWLSLFM